jgi:hypothetical protein
MKVKNEPIVLSGRVYLDGILADDLSHLALPAKLLVGDIKLHNVLKSGSRPRFGQTVSFSGFIVANVYDGKSFRRLLLRKLGAVESTYVGPVQRRERSATIVRYLRTLVRRQAVWFATDHGYEVTRNTVAPATQPESKAASQPVTAAPVSPAAQPVAPAKAVSQPVATAPVTPATTVATTHERTSVHTRVPVRRRRSRGRKVDENQLPLFTDLK